MYSISICRAIPSPEVSMGPGLTMDPTLVDAELEFLKLEPQELEGGMLNTFHTDGSYSGIKANEQSRMFC